DPRLTRCCCEMSASASRRDNTDRSPARSSPRHFVPGYDRTVPPGHFATGSNLPCSSRKTPGGVFKTIGSDGWLLTVIVLQSLFLVGPCTDRAAVGRLRPQTNFLMRLLLSDP